ncbi:cell division protein FtsA [Candidatus Saccharibacteria bacterium]|nr:cell division protein FtsA [Candidatus Saccharibacteria bacterium]
MLDMQETSRYAVGLDIGTSKVRVVVGHLEEPTQSPTIVGVASEPNIGMRKGTVVNLVNVAQAIDKALESAERMSGHQIQHATISINGSHIVGISSKGVIAVGVSGHEIALDDLERVQEAATVLQLPANREIVEVTPRSYQLDGQENIKDPLGMTGVRLEVDAHVITALAPHVKNLEKVCEMTETGVDNIMLSGLAAARSVLDEKQMENGVLLIDMGVSTTNLAVFDEGDLQHVAVLPVGGNNITNDLAIGLKTELDVAEQVKIQHAVAHSDLRRGHAGKAVVKIEDAEHIFETSEIDMIVDARLEEIFEQINSELKAIGRAAQLPGGVVLTGGGAELKGIADYAKQALQLSARVGQPTGYAGVVDQIYSPSYAVVTGLMLSNLLDGAQRERSTEIDQSKNGGFAKRLSSGLLKMFSKNRS